MSVFNAPMAICKKLDKAIKDFLWHGTDISSTMPLIRWDIVSAPKASGGLGVFKTKDSNKALKIKWLWRYFSEDRPLWKIVIQAKYRTSHIGGVPFVSKFYSSWAPWFAICKLRDLFSRHTRWDLHNGEKILFWYDKWLDTGPLHKSLPRFCSMTDAHHISVKEA